MEQNMTGADYKTKEVAARIRELRLITGLSLEEMAQLSGYSPSRFLALYKTCYGISPKAELLQARLSMAKQMLSYSDLSITAIANACGFQSVYYFSKYFRKYTGTAPSQWGADS